VITVTLDAEEADTLRAAANHVILMLAKDAKRPELTEAGRENYAAMLRVAQRARDKLEEGALCE